MRVQLLSIRKRRTDSGNGYDNCERIRRCTGTTTMARAARMY